MTVENLTITVKTNADKAALKLDTLTRAIDKVQVSANGLSGGAITNLTALANAMNTIAGLSITTRAFTGLANGLSKLADAAILITSDVIYNLERVVNVLSKLQGVNLNGVGAALNGVSRAANKVGASTRTASAGIKEVGKAANKAQTPLGNFLASLKRIAFYRIIRGIIKSITQAFSDGLEKAYLFSSGIVGEGNRFAQAMDSIKSKGNEMKGQLGSAFIGLLTAIEPILNALINIVTKAADAMSQFFAAFTGKTYLKANATAAKFADTMQRGGAAAKEWKNQLLGFDEINRLNEPSSGGGGSANNPLDGYEFVDAPINQKLLDFINNIKERLQPAIDRLKESFGRLKDAWDRFIENFDGAPLAQFFEDLVSLPIEVIINSLTVLCDTLTLVLDVLTALNTGDWSHVWIGFKQLLYDVIVLVMDLFVGITNLVMDAFIALAGAIDSVIGTHLADYLQADNDAFNEMYTASRDSEDGLWGLKRILGLTETSTEKLAEEAQGLTVDLEGVGTEADDLNTRVSGVRDAVDWVLEGFIDFGTEVGWIITSLFQPLADLCAWIDSALQGFKLLSFQKVNSPRYDVWSDPDAWTSNFATGGFPSEGQLFVANEAGPELVGTMGGHTAVANNDQIVEGIRQGVYDAVVAANANGNSDVSVKVYLDSREIRAGQERLARAWG